MIANLRAQNFRSYGDASFEFEPGVNIVVGPNASGKTNLLEAVLVLASGSSYRGRDSELIMFRKAWSRLDGQFQSSMRSIKTKRVEDALDKEYVIDDKSYRRLSLDKTEPTVYFEPNHLQLIARGPDQRRDYFDDLLVRSDASLKSAINAYRRTLAQRNALLKQARHQGESQIFAWNIRLSELGEKIAQSRAELVERANKTLSKSYSHIARTKSELAIDYASQFPIDRYGSRLLSKLESNLQADYERGFTGYGPHREDFIFYLNGQPANTSASRGESRSAMLALKIFELTLITKARGAKPIFFVDDVFSELDGGRRHALVDFISDYQSIITTTDADSVIGYFDKNSKLIALTPSKRVKSR
jgi:DNA replication and repair protein RecF